MSPIHIKGVETPEEQDAADDLFAKIHFGDYFNGRRQLAGFFANYPEYRREHTRLLLLDGQLVSALRLFSHTIRVGEARLKMGGVGFVTTVGAYRKKGYLARLMNDTMRLMLTRGYHVSTLFGIADFYHRWGFASVLPEYSSVIDLREASGAPVRPHKLRKSKPGDIAAIQRIHAQNDTDTAGSVIRSSAHITNDWERWCNSKVVTDDNGKVVAYILADTRGGDYCVEEIGVADFPWCHAALNACVTLARAEYASRLRFSAPPSHPFVKQMLQFRSDHEVHVSRDSNGMMAVVNIEETLECMIPEWESLLRNGTAATLRAEFTLVVDRKPFRVRAHRGAVDVAAATGANKISLNSLELTQLLLGYRHLDELLALKRRMVNSDGKTLLALLFPKRIPYVWPRDRF